MLTIQGQKFLKEKELSSKYGLSIHWFRKARYNGNSPSYHKLHGQVYYNENEVEEWFKKNMIQYQ